MRILSNFILKQGIDQSTKIICFVSEKKAYGNYKRIPKHVHSPWKKFHSDELLWRAQKGPPISSTNKLTGFDTRHGVLMFLSSYIRPIWLPWATIINSKLKFVMENSSLRVDRRVWVSGVVVLLMILNVNDVNDIASDIEFRFVNRLITPCDVCTLPLRGGA